jgi:hypothetical protein
MVSGFAKVCYALSLAACCVAGALLFFAVAMPQSAPQQAAGAAIALGVAVIPYVFSRAVEKLAGPSKAPQLESSSVSDKPRDPFPLG